MARVATRVVKVEVAGKPYSVTVDIEQVDGKFVYEFPGSGKPTSFYSTLDEAVQQAAETYRMFVENSLADNSDETLESGDSAI